MNGIFGVWHIDGRPARRSELEQSTARLTSEGSGAICWTDGPFGLTCRRSTSSSTEVHSSIGRSGAIACVLQGRLDDRDRLERALGTSVRGSSPCSNAAVVAAAYREYGDRTFERLHGEFACAIADLHERRLVIGHDRLGLRPLCYARFGDTFAFATDAKALLAYSGRPATPDESMLADFVLYFLAADGRHRTFFEGIQALPPAHCLTATSEGVSLHQYFEFSAAPIRFRTAREYAEELHQLVSSSVRKRLSSPTPVAVAVSGGLDSSYLLCLALGAIREAPGLCPGVLGVNFDGAPGTPSDEREFIDEIERSYDVAIARIPERPGFASGAREDVWWSESPLVDGMGGLHHAVRRRLREAGVGRLLTGHWGDQVLVDSDYLLDLVRSGRWRELTRHRKKWGIGLRRLAVRFARDLFEGYARGRAARMIRRARTDLDGAWSHPWFTPSFRKLLRERFSADRLPAFQGSSHGRAIWRQAHLGYFVQCMQWNVRLAAGADLDMAFPYLDCDLLQFLMGIPGEVLSLDGQPRGLMREAMRGTVPEAIRTRRHKGEFTHVVNDGILEDFELVEDLLAPDALAVRFGYLDGAAIRERLDDWRAAVRGAQDAVVADRILDLCGLELMLRTFFSDGSATPA